MSAKIVETTEGITLLAGGPATRRDLSLALARAPVLVAADGGANRALALGLMPEAAIGDFDSIRAGAREALGPGRLLHIGEQESTDFDKALGAVSAPFIIGLGALGGRVDHALAVLHTLVHRAAHHVVLLGGPDVVFAAAPGRWLDLALGAGDRLSLFPLAAVMGESEGLEWPIKGLAFDPARKIGTSNRVTKGPVRLRFEGEGMIVILPRRRLDAVLRALRP
ncbi:thiamine diphosphokinase [Neogemmobacter tilapiae]|uniref:Thiamine diphosphokinase n=1 Tax=Neogemmobacter tilapiae TaxID=875041 RepID=A0A918TTF2_9RHOB|nr:thiamine diphosphokinase [Gemmobacter tilapiae]GHC62201.1 thiamine pyrophosphokinase [Gemmobacter tilapiae]